MKIEVDAEEGMMGSSHHVGHCVCNPDCARVTVAAKDERIEALRKESEEFQRQLIQSYADRRGAVEDCGKEISALRKIIAELQEERLRKPFHVCPSCEFDFGDWDCPCKDTISALNERIKELEASQKSLREEWQIDVRKVSALTQKIEKARSIVPRILNRATNVEMPILSMASIQELCTELLAKLQ